MYVDNCRNHHILLKKVHCTPYVAQLYSVNQSAKCANFTCLLSLKEGLVKKRKRGSGLRHVGMATTTV